MAKIDTAFLTKRSKNDMEIQKATYRNISRIEDDDIKEIHQNLLRTLELKSEKDSIYFSYENFETLVLECREKKEKAIKRAKKREKNNY